MVVSLRGTHRYALAGLADLGVPMRAVSPIAPACSGRGASCIYCTGGPEPHLRPSAARRTSCMRAAHLQYSQSGFLPLIRPSICASVKRLFRIRLLLQGWADPASDRGNFCGAGQALAGGRLGWRACGLLFRPKRPAQTSWPDDQGITRPGRFGDQAGGSCDDQPPSGWQRTRWPGPISIRSDGSGAA